MKTIEEARAEAARYATQGFILTEHMSIALADEPMSAMLAAPYFVQSQGAWYAGSHPFASLPDAMAACESINDGRLGRMFVEASRAARGAVTQPPRPALPPSIDLAELWAENERLRAVAKAAMTVHCAHGSCGRAALEIGRARAALEDALGRLHDQDFDGSRWRTLPTVDHAPAVGFGANRTIARTAAAQAAAVTLDAPAPDDLLDQTRPGYDDKLAIASEALETCAKFRDGRVLITMDARSPGAHAPELPGWSRHEFTFAIGLRMQAPTLVDDYGVTACLSFKGEVHLIRAPWSSIWRIASADDSAGFIYIDEGAEPLEVNLAHEDSAPPKGPTEATPPQPAPAAPGGNVIPFRRPR